MRSFQRALGSSSTASDGADMNKLRNRINSMIETPSAKRRVG